MTLKPRILLLTALIFCVSAIGAIWVTRLLAENVLEEWAVRYTNLQSLYMKNRALAPILHEVEIAKKLASQAAVRNWANTPDDNDLKNQSLALLEKYRTQFHDQQAFIALSKTSAYYYNNEKSEYLGREQLYILDPALQRDKWFFKLIKQNLDVQINVQPDANLGITNVWINIPIRHNNEILGMSGTGMHLKGVINELIVTHEDGVSSLFVDDAGAIQIHQNQALINFASVTKDAKEQKTFSSLLDSSNDQKSLQAAMAELRQGERQIATRFVSINGKKYLLGLTRLSEINWYQITLLDLEILLPRGYFAGIALVYAITLLTALLLLNLVLNRLVLQPLGKLNDAMTLVAEGAPAQLEANQADNSEITRLITHFTQMSSSVLSARHELEDKVKERTAELDRQVKIDPLTELLNRRGMNEHIALAISQARRSTSAIGVLWLDVDWFKEVNDTYGHEVGDAALKTIAEIIRSNIRPYDAAARWGGDEFLVLLSAVDDDLLDRVGARIHAAVANQNQLLDHSGKTIGLSVSVGGYLFPYHGDIEHLLSHADQALYSAKAHGRNCYRKYNAQGAC